MSMLKMALVLVNAILLASLLLTPGCANARLWLATFDRVISDGAGGAIALYDVMKNASRREFYAQRIAPDGQRLWGDRGTLVGNADKGTAAATNIRLVSDGDSGAIIAQRNTGYAPGKQTTTVTRVSSEGKVLWQRDSAPIDRIVSGGDGGAVIAWVEGTTISVNRFDSNGQLPWGQTGVSFGRPRYGTISLEVTGDGAGGAILAWLESDPQRAKPSNSGTNDEIYAQRIDPEGKLAWGVDGVRVYVSPADAAGSWLRISDDASGKSLLTWEQHPTVGVQDDSPTGFLSDICVQALDTTGAGAWQPNGSTLGISREAGVRSTPHAPLIVRDGSGGAVVVWQDARDIPQAVYAQRVSANGTTQWAAGGIKMFDVHSGRANRIQVIGDENGGVIVSLTFYDLLSRQHGVRVRKLDAEGNSPWVVEPANISVDLTVGTHYTVSDGEGGALFAWSTRNTDLSDSEASFMQRIGPGGELMWGKDGVRLDE